MEASSVTVLDLPDALLQCVLVLLAPCPEDVAHAALSCRAFSRALRLLQLTRREFACAACGHVVVLSDAKVILKPGPRAVRQELARSVVVEFSGIDVRSLSCSVDAVAATLSGEPDDIEMNPVRYPALLCPCGLLLGHVTSDYAILYLNLLCRRLVGGALDPARSVWQRPPGHLRCAGCTNALADSEAVLSMCCPVTLAPTWLVNHLLPGAFVRGNQRPLQLGWLFSVEDLSCAACGAHIGLALGPKLIDEDPWMALHAGEEPETWTGVHLCSGRFLLSQDACRI